MVTGGRWVRYVRVRRDQVRARVSTVDMTGASVTVKVRVRGRVRVTIRTEVGLRLRLTLRLRLSLGGEGVGSVLVATPGSVHSTGLILGFALCIGLG